MMLMANVVWRRWMSLVAFLLLVPTMSAQMGTPTPLPAAEREKAAAESRAAGQLADYPLLADITASTGIHFQHLSSPEAKYIVESMSGGVALIDYDRDGWPDIYFTNAPSVEMAQHGQRARSALYHNNHDGTFTDVTENAGVGYPCWAMGAVVGDYNNDGWPDLLVTCLNGVVLYRNNGDGGFTNVTSEVGLSGDAGWATGAAFGDYDRDGWVDLFVAHYVDFHLGDLPAFGSSKSCKYLGLDVQCGPRGLKGASDNLYRNLGNGKFSDVSKQSGVDDPERRYGLTALWSDFDNDGNLDLFVANDGQPNYLYKGDGKGHFDEVALTSGVAVNNDGFEQANMGVAAGDPMHAGKSSLLISHFDNEYAAYFKNEGSMNFTDESIASGIARGTQGFVGWGDAFVDFSNSGWQDFLLVNGHVYPQVDSTQTAARYKEPKLLFLNQRNGNFRNISLRVGDALKVPQVSRGMAIGDLFNDGRLEAVVENLVGEPMILRPEGGPPNHWISFQLESMSRNRLALNARVRVTAGGQTQMEEVQSGGSYLSQHDLRLHFGLGHQNSADTVEILWPDGSKQQLNGLAADKFYTVREGEGVIAVSLPQPYKILASARE
jgi:hypothetical protein